MKVTFNTIYDELIVITKVDVIEDFTDEIQIVGKLDGDVDVYIEGTDEAERIFHAPKVRIPVSIISKEIKCSADRG